jgi:hypothetical protein
MYRPGVVGERDDWLRVSVTEGEESISSDLRVRRRLWVTE